MLEAPPLAPGTRAPDFTLAASDGSTVTGNHTPGCDRQLRALTDEVDRYRVVGIHPFGVNPASVADHRAYAEALGLPFRLLSDPGLVVARRWQAVTPLEDQVLRTVYLVDRDGIIRFAARGMPGADITLEAFEEA